MEILWATSVVVVIGVAIWSWERLTDRATTGYNWHMITRSARAQGAMLQRGPLVFRTSGAADQVQRWVLSQLEVCETTPRLNPGLTVKGVDDDTTHFAIGSALSGELAAFDLTLAQDGEGTTGTVALRSWEEDRGVMRAAERVARVYGQIAVAVLAADSQAAVDNPLEASASPVR